MKVKGGKERYAGKGAKRDIKVLEVEVMDNVKAKKIAQQERCKVGVCYRKRGKIESRGVL